MQKLLLIVLSLAVLGGFCLTSCESNPEFQQITSNQAPLPQGEAGLVPCHGTIRYSTCYSIASNNSLQNGDNQFVLHPDTSAYYRLGPFCECDWIEYCVVFSFPPDMAVEFAVGDKNLAPSDCKVLDFDGFNSYFDHHNPLGTRNDPNIREVCFSGKEQLVIRTPAGIVNILDLSRYIVSVSGFCIIDNIADPKVEDTTEYPCML